MAAVVRALREKLGDEAMGGLQTFVEDAGHKWKDEVLTLATERFNRRLGEEIGALRLDMAKEFATVRVETAKESATVRMEMAAMGAGLRTEMAATHFSMLKWAFLFWIGQFAAVSAMMAFLLRLYR
jgi:hypothetical protein